MKSALQDQVFADWIRHFRMCCGSATCKLCGAAGRLDHAQWDDCEMSLHTCRPGTYQGGPCGSSLAVLS
eukprot:1161658-Pelagomonas_calceolata.AAC.10